MTDAKCIYVGHDAGVVHATELLDGESRYEFVPYRSPAHLQLEKKLAAKGAAHVIVEWHGKPVNMTVTAMEPASITMRKDQRQVEGV